MTTEDPRLRDLNAEKRQIAAEFLSLNNSWDTSFAVFPSFGDGQEEGFRIRWEDEKAFAEFRWLRVAGQPYREFEVSTERSKWSEKKMPYRSLKNARFAKVVRRFAR